MAIRVIKPGLLTTIQDLGRWGYQSRGVPVAGPMDPYAHRLANALVANAPDAALLEVTLVGPALWFDDERIVAVAGAEFEMSVDGQGVTSAGAFVVAAGRTLRFAGRRRGTRAYLAVAGGIDTPAVLGSRATHVTSRMGGIEGRPLRTGDLLPLGAARAGRVPDARGVPRPDLPAGDATVRVLPGPQRGGFTDDALETLQSGAYTIEAASNRMAFRLDGPALRHVRDGNIISDATPMGTLQVPGSGMPILLMADRQTTGGYAQLATVITADLGVVGQLAPGDRISFTVCSMREARSALLARERELIALEAPGR